MTWFDVMDGPRIAAMVEARGLTVAIRSFGTRRDQLEAMGLDGKNERSHPRAAPTWTLHATPMDLPEVITILGPDFEAWLDNENPGWRTWIAHEQELNTTRDHATMDLSRSCRLSEPSLLQTVPLATFSNTVPTDSPYHRLYLYQQLGVWWLHHAKMRAILGDEMGVGKTPQSLVALELDDNVRHAVCIVPAAVLINWQREAAVWAPSFATQLCTSKWSPPKHPPQRLLLLISWGLVHRMMDQLLGHPWDAVVVDEAHRMKERTSLRTQAATALLHSSSRRLLATGTYLRSSHHELFSLLHAIHPLGWPRWLDYGERFCDPKQKKIAGRVITTYTGSTRSKELMDRTLPWIMRRTRAQVLPHLPPKRRQYLHQRAPRDLAKRTLELYQALRDTDPAKYAEAGLLVEINEIWQQTGLAKVGAAVEWIEDAIAHGEPVVVFIFHKAVRQKIIDTLDERRIGHSSVVGGMTPKAKTKAVDAFMNGDVDVLIGSDAAKEGLTLVRAAFSLHVERWWVPADEEQAEDRLNRPGQECPTTAVCLHMDKTLDDYMERISARKRAVVGAATSSIRAELIETIHADVD